MKKSLIIMIFMMTAVTVAAQEQVSRNETGRPPVKERMFYGGSFGLQFGTITNIEAAPLVGIWLLPRLAVGAGPSFQYYRDPYDGTTIYGGRAMVEISIIQSLNNIIPIGLTTGIFIEGEYNGLSLEKSFFSTATDSSGRIYYDCFLAGAGITQPTGKKSCLNITFLWCVTGNEYGLYDSPEIRFEFYF